MNACVEPARISASKRTTPAAIGTPPASRSGVEATRSKVLKVLKVLNFPGTGKSNTFTCTFTGAAAEDPEPAALGRALPGDGHVLGFARRIERALPDPPGSSFHSQLLRGPGCGGQGLPQSGAGVVDNGAPSVAIVLGLPL
jgi:hypothetical protein